MSTNENTIQLRVKRVHPDAKLPQYATDGSACFDLHAVGINGFSRDEHEVLCRVGIDRTTTKISDDSASLFGTGLKFEVPEGHVMLIFSRSGHGFIRNVRLSNCVGVIDSDYRGEVAVKLRRDGSDGSPLYVKSGDRIAQAMIVPIPRVQLIEVDELSDTDRGAGGFGSTGS